MPVPPAYPDVPERLLAQWQELMNMLALDCQVPSALIMRLHPAELEVLISGGDGSPYHAGERERLSSGLYCEHVIATRARLLVPNALADPAWDDNPDVALGMISYLGYPLLWPDGEPFGTVCLLDREENAYSVAIDGKLALFRRIVESNLSLIFETAGHRRTIAALTESQQQLHEAVLRANAADRTKTDFLARVGHDLRAPLTAIIGYAQLLQESDAPAARHAQVIERSGKHMLTLINDLVEYASGSLRDELAPLPHRLAGFIDGIAREAEMLARRNGNRFRLRLGADLPPVVFIDARRLRQIIGNLLDNAAKFTHRGSLALIVNHRPGSAPDGHTTLEIEVRDNGCGISAEDQPRLFEPFFRCDDSRRIEGTGLGLPIVDLWVKRMGGQLRLDSRPNAGTRVRVGIPVRVGSERDISAAEPGPDAPAPRFGDGRRLWVIEDMAATRSFLIAALEEAGFVVDSAADGQIFLERLRAGDTARPSLVLTDLNMPGADGHAVLAAVRERWPGVPVVLLTGQSLSGASRGFDARLPKPIDVARLRATLAGLLPPTPPKSPKPARRAPVRRPGAEALARMRALVALGALTDLVEWAEALAAEAPGHADFAREVLATAERWDLEALQALCR